MGKGLIDKIFDSIFDSEWTGRYGEKLTAKKLKWVKFFGRKGEILRNIYIPKDNGDTSEIDVLYITQKGIFVFESKNYSGWIFGDEDDYYWTVSLQNGIKNKLYNPIKQNKTHMKWLGKYIGEDIPLFSIIVFSERCEFKKISVKDENVKVIKRDRTYATVRDIWEAKPDILDEIRVKEIAEKLRKLTNVDEAVKLEHIENIEKRYNKKKKEVKENIKSISNKEPKENIELESNEELKENTEQKSNEESKNNISQNGDTDKIQDESEKICPRCGGKLVLRIAKKGENAGKQFYGCERFPKCRYIENIELK